MCVIEYYCQACHTVWIIFMALWCHMHANVNKQNLYNSIDWTVEESILYISISSFQKLDLCMLLICNDQ